MKVNKKLALNANRCALGDGYHSSIIDKISDSSKEDRSTYPLNKNVLKEVQQSHLRGLFAPTQSKADIGVKGEVSVGLIPGNVQRGGEITSASF